MKSIEIDDDLYAFIAGETKHIGESASDILRRLLMPQFNPEQTAETQPGQRPAEPAVGKPATAQKATVTAAANKAAAQKTATSSRATGGQKSAPAASRGRKTVNRGEILKRATPEALKEYTKRVDLFLFMLAQLHELHPESFKQVEQIKGKNRVYFATSKEALLNTGSSTNPKQIPGSAYWVVTNNNTAKKVAMLEQVLQLLGYDQATCESLMNRFS